MYYIEMVQECSDETTLDYRLCIAIKKMINKSKNLYAYLDKLYMSIDEMLNPIYKQLVLEFIMTYCQSVNDYKNLAKYSMELNKILAQKLLMFEH